MNITCPAGSLPAAVRAASRFCPARPAMPVLGTALLRATGSRLTVSATDLATGIEIACDADVRNPGAVAVQAKLLADIAASIPDEPIQITAHGDAAVIAAGAARFEVPVTPAADFPMLPEPPADASVTIGGPALAALIRATAYAASTDEARPILTGVSVSIERGRIRLAATDGARLALHELRDGAASGSLAGVVPARALAEAARLLSAKDQARVAWSRNALFVHAGAARLSTRFLEGTFPTYQQILDAVRAPTATVTAPREPLAAAVRRAVIAASHGQAVRIAADGGAVVLRASSPDLGSAVERLDGVKIEGGPLEAAFKAGFLMDAVAATDAPLVRLALTGAASPASIAPEGASMPIAVIAPVRV